MANTYYDSELTAEEIEEVLEAINGILNPANNGKVLAISNGKFEARSVQWSGEEPVLESLSVTENGDYYPESGVDGFDEVHVAVPSSSPTIQSLSVTQNGTYTAPSGVDGYSPIVVNVSGGGPSNVLFGDDAPTASLGSDGDYYIRTGAAEKWIRIDITKVARGTDYNFTYYGSRAISLVCKDAEQNEIEISQYITQQKYWKGQSLLPSGSDTTVFRSTIGNYVENNGLPGHYAALFEIPSSYTLHKIKLTRRNSSQYHDYWATFDVYQCDISGNNLSLLLSEQDLTESDWNDWNSFTEFTPTGQLINVSSHLVYHKENGVWVLI